MINWVGRQYCNYRIFCPICVRTVPHTPLLARLSLKMWVSLLERHQHAWIIRQLDAHRPLCANSAHGSSSSFFFFLLSQRCVTLWLGLGTIKRSVRVRKISRFCSKYRFWSLQISAAAEPTSCFFMLQLHFPHGSGFDFSVVAMLCVWPWLGLGQDHVLA